MAKGRVTVLCAKCGAVFDKQKYFSDQDDAIRWENWTLNRTNYCKNCFASACSEQVEAETRLADKVASENAFGIELDAIDLKGNEKQNDWAKRIIASTIVELESCDTPVWIISMAINIARDKGCGEDDARRIASEKYGVLNGKVVSNEKVAEFIYPLIAEEVCRLTAPYAITTRKVLTNRIKYNVMQKVAKDLCDILIG